MMIPGRRRDNGEQLSPSNNDQVYGIAIGERSDGCPKKGKEGGEVSASYYCVQFSFEAQAHLRQPAQALALIADLNASNPSQLS